MRTLQTLLEEVQSSEVPSKEHLQEILGAVEELYRYAKGPRSRENEARSRLISAIDRFRGG